MLKYDSSINIANPAGDKQKNKLNVLSVISLCLLRTRKTHTGAVSQGVLWG